MLYYKRLKRYRVLKREFIHRLKSIKSKGNILSVKREYIEFMRLFGIIPNNFFNGFYSENRDVYSEVLLVLWKAYKNSSYILSRDECSIILCAF